MRKFIFVFFIFIFSATAATVKQEMLSPVTTKAAPYFWTGTAITTVLVITEDQISDPASKETHEDTPLGSFSKVGDLYGQMVPNAIYAMGMWAHGKWGKAELSSSRASHMVKATLYAVAVTSALKYTIREPRPDNIHEKNSFPSGHSTTAFAFASVVAVQHEWYWGTLALGMATLTAYSRMNDGRHFLHDVVAGMTIGTSYGLGVYYAQKGDGQNVSFVPIYDDKTIGIRLVKSF